MRIFGLTKRFANWVPSTRFTKPPVRAYYPNFIWAGLIIDKNNIPAIGHLPFSSLY